jgi:hypothetical protein
LAALAIVVSLPVLHEGSEVVLFLYGIFASGASGTAITAFSPLAPRARPCCSAVCSASPPAPLSQR